MTVGAIGVVVTFIKVVIVVLVGVRPINLLDVLNLVKALNKDCMIRGKIGHISFLYPFS